MPEGFPQQPFDDQEQLSGLSRLQEQGLESLAEMRISAHGGEYTVADAMTECPPFASMISGLAANLEGVPNKKEILENTIKSMASNTVSNEAVETKKKLN